MKIKVFKAVCAPEQTAFFSGERHFFQAGDIFFRRRPFFSGDGLFFQETAFFFGSLLFFLQPL
jgi:hypothetical protein